ncbi:response regulator [Celeribacter halophilus]|uniref:response regulator n=1 Tax=Celeribacter halophilus TaxID=576117 RepID=UPI003A8CAD21
MAILVVDDDRNIRTLIEEILRSDGYEDIQCAESGREALELIIAGDERFSTIFLDIQMPEMDGIELCGHIRALPEYRQTPIIMLTSMKDKDHVDAAFMQGATDYMTKPIDITEMHARLRVAQMLFEEQTRAQEAQNREADLRLGMGASAHPASDTQFEFADPVIIYDVPRVIGSTEMENYLHRMSHVQRFMFSAIAFQIDRPERLFSLSTPVEFYDILTDVAEAVFENTRQYDPMISYAGEGKFIAVLPRTVQLDRDELEAELSLTLREFGLIGGETVPMDVTVSAGDVVKMSMFDSTPQKMFNRALMSVSKERNTPRRARVNMMFA